MKTFALFVMTLAVTIATSVYISTTNTPTATAATETSIVHPSVGNPQPADASLLEPGKTVKKITLSDANTVFVLGEISANSQDIADSILDKEKTQKEIYVAINSPGGSVMDGALVVSAIQQSTKPVYTVCLQLCASEAAVIHAYGTERYMVDRSILMHHPAAGGLQGSLPEMNSLLKTITRFVNKTEAYIANRAGIPFDEYLNMVNRQVWLDAYDATQKHFNDQVVSVTFNIKKDSKQSLANTKRMISKEFGLENFK